MKMYIDRLLVEGSENDFEILRVRLQTISRAFEELAKLYKSLSMTDLSIEYRMKSNNVAYALERGADNHDI